MSVKTPQSLLEALNKFFTVSYSTKLAIKRTYDDWAIKQIWHDKLHRIHTVAQKLDVVQHQKLGSDLATSKFVFSYCMGQVQDYRGRWIKKEKDLPPDYQKSFKVTAINVSRAGLITEGIDNFVGLEHLEFLDLSLNPSLDDFACDQLARQFRNSKTLREIDLSYNPRISVYGLEILFRIPSIKRIVAIETMASSYEDIDLFVLAAEDERKCEVLVHKNGRKYTRPEIEDPKVVPLLTTIK